MLDLFDDPGSPPLQPTGPIGTIVRLDRHCDRTRPCCDNLAVVYAGHGPHGAELRCADCDRHRGWLPKAALDFLKTTAARFGAPTEPLILRDSTIGEHIMEKKQYDNSGILFRDDRKANEKDRDYRGEITINGVQFWLSGWIKEGQKGKFMSLAVKPKDAPATQANPKASAAAGNDFHDDLVPF